METVQERECIVKLNVGGTTFMTTWSTLLPRTEGSTNFFTGLKEFGVGAQRDENGAYFVDRDATLFGGLLQYLRTGVLQGNAVYSREMLVLEAEYYGIVVPSVAAVVDNEDDVVMLHVYGAATTQNFIKAVQVHVFGPLDKATQTNIRSYLDEYEQRDKNVFEVPSMRTPPTVSVMVMNSCLDLGLVYKLVALICQGHWKVTSHSNTIIPECPHQKTASSFTRWDFQFTFARHHHRKG